MNGIEELRGAYSEGRLDDAWALYRQLEATGEASPEVHLLGARVAEARSELIVARFTVDKALAGGASGPLLGRIRFTAGVIYLRVGEVRGAIDLFRVFMAGGAEYPDILQMAEGHAWFNLGLALRQARDYDGSLDAYQRAAAAHRRNDLQASLCETLHNLAWVACLMGNRVLADEALLEAAPICTSDHLKLHQQLGEAFAGALGDEPDQRRALELCDSLVGSYGKVPEAIRSHACWLAGKVALRQGALDLAEDMARQAVGWAAKVTAEGRCLNDAADLLRAVRGERIRLQTGA